jgi:hypothetical protein
MQYSVRFYISWIVAAIIMYSAFYAWHGLFLNDLERITFPKGIFLGMAALVYLVISYVLYRAYNSRLTARITSPFLRGMVVGVGLGFILFAVITVLGISFTKNMNMTYLVADCAWQMVEQCLGGIVVCVVQFLVFEPHPEFIEHNQ